MIKNEFVPWAPWNTPLDKAKVAMVSTGGVFLKRGLHHPFGGVGDASFREFPSVVTADDLNVSHPTLDLSYAQADPNVLFPLERLKQLAHEGYMGSVAPFVYSFMGEIPDPTLLLSNYAPSVAYRMKRMGAEVVLVVAAGGALDHQTAGLVARAIELAGIPTIVLGTDRAALEAVHVPRGALVKHPGGAPLGNPGNVGKHQHLLRNAFEESWQLEGPGLCVDLPFEWHG
jgi:D-proline reductase (dithiol) PrdB